MRYITRHIENKVRSYLKQFPVVIITGSRQVGKSTMLKHMFHNNEWKYVSLDLRSVVERINADPDLFVKDIDSNIIIDEAQKAPALFHSLKYLIDKGTPYKIILSGSANFMLLSNVTETLAGRAGILELYPFCIGEVHRKAGTSIITTIYQGKKPEDVSNAKNISLLTDKQNLNNILFGGYPRLLQYKEVEPKLNWFENYITTYIERDLRNLANVGDISDFQRFYKILAFQTGNILNMSTIAGDIGISVPTCKKYLNILEASYQHTLLKPYHMNIRKRLVKSPKVYIVDTGLGNFFMGNDSLDRLKNTGSFGHIVETWVLGEFIKYNNILPRKRNLYYWRTSNGAEIDLIIENGANIIPVEIKTSVQIRRKTIRGLEEFMALKQKAIIPFGIVFYRGEDIYKISNNIWAIPITAI